MTGWILILAAAAQPAVATAAEMERAAAELRGSGGAAGPLSRGLAGRRFQFTVAPRERGPEERTLHRLSKLGVVSRAAPV